MAAQPPPLVVSLAAHPIGAERNRVDGGHLEAGVVEARMAAGDEPENVMIPGPGIEERHEAVDPVADAKPEHLGVEVGHLLRLRREKQRVPETARHDIVGRRRLHQPDPEDRQGPRAVGRPRRLRQHAQLRRDVIKGYDRMMQLLKDATAGKERTPRTHQNAAYAIAVAPDGSWLAGSRCRLSPSGPLATALIPERSR